MNHKKHYCFNAESMEKETKSMSNSLRNSAVQLEKSSLQRAKVAEGRCPWEYDLTALKDEEDSDKNKLGTPLGSPVLEMIANCEYKKNVHDIIIVMLSNCTYEYNRVAPTTSKLSLGMFLQRNTNKN